MDTAHWDDLVAKGLQAAKFQWTLGDLALEVETIYSHGELQRYAKEIGVEYETLKGYKWVAGRWEKVLRRTDLPFSVYKDLAARPDRFDLIKQVVPGPGACDRARKLIGYKGDNGTRPAAFETADPEVRKQVAMQVLRDPNTRTEILNELADDIFVRPAMREAVWGADAKADAERAHVHPTVKINEPDIINLLEEAVGAMTQAQALLEADKNLGIKRHRNTLAKNHVRAKDAFAKLVVASDYFSTSLIEIGEVLETAKIAEIASRPTRSHISNWNRISRKEGQDG